MEMSCWLESWNRKMLFEPNDKPAQKSSYQIHCAEQYEGRPHLECIK
jgi:hypothetical protein